MDQREEFKRTIVHGENAIGHLKANETPAYPRNYELWYTYSAGYNQALNRAINDLLRQGGHLSLSATDKIYEQFLSPLRFGDRVDHIGDQLSGELRNIMVQIGAVRDETSVYGTTLKDASGTLADSNTDRDVLRTVVEHLITATSTMEERTADLESKLAASRRQVDELQLSLEAIRNETLTDPLTGLANRKCLDQVLARALSEAESTGKAFSILVADVDHFKKFNDTYGHQTGDQVLRLVATSLKQNVKGQDVAARYGGEEFCVLLPRTPLEPALTVAEHIREAVMSKELVKRSTGERMGRITVSVGVATWRFGDSVVSLIDRADAAMYVAKRSGRNRVASETQVSVETQQSVA